MNLRARSCGRALFFRDLAHLLPFVARSRGNAAVTYPTRRCHPTVIKCATNGHGPSSLQESIVFKSIQFRLAALALAGTVAMLLKLARKEGN